MVNELFQTVLGMSLTGAVVILLVLAARLLLRGAPRVFSYALWAVVLVRLLCPFTPESALSLVPSARIVEVPGIGDTTAEIFEVSTGIPAVDDGLNDFFATHPYQGYVPAELPPDGPLPVIPQTGDASDWRTVPAVLWAAGGGALLAYSVISLARLRRRLVGAIPLVGESGVWLADHIDTPFVLGLFRPRIYLPSALPEGEREYVLLHERTHIRRLDHATRALAWIALCLHWFNPLAWLAFHLAGKDMETSCDEAVLRRADRDARADYAASLLRLSAGKKLPVGPLAFGDGDPKSRIKNVLNYKKPAFWVIVVALAAVIAAGAVLITGRPFPGVVGPGRPLVAWIEDDVTEVKITHFAGGQATEWSVSGGDLKPLQEWVNGLTYDPAELEGGDTPGDTEGGEVYRFELTGGGYPDFDYIISGADRYVLIEGHWRVILEPSDPPVGEPDEAARLAEAIRGVEETIRGMEERYAAQN